MSRTCRTHEREEMHTELWWEILKEIDHIEALRVG
jgi:hypothetical protein